MVLTTHALVGAFIGKNAQNPWIIITLSFAFHYIFDAIRHGEYVDNMENKNAFRNTFWKVALDFSIGLAILLSVVYAKRYDNLTTMNIFIGAFSSVLPDLFTFIYWKFRWKFFEKLYKFHIWCHRLPRNAPEREWNFGNEIYEITIFLTFLIALLIF